ncbi:MAG: hypothetical protein KI793_23570 [Rivularia sp. (in: Bacteria)]|nr:hypothetical protein [Rivularia sp. MS3]
MKYRDSSQRLDINCLLHQLINVGSTDSAPENSEPDINCLLDELINLQPINLAQKKSGLDISRLLHTLQQIKRDCEFKPNCRLTQFEKRYLCLCLYGYSGREIAFIYDENRLPRKGELIKYKDRLDARIRNLQKEASKGLNKYLKLLLGLEESANKPRTGELIRILKEKGYGIKYDNNKKNSFIRVNRE